MQPEEDTEGVKPHLPEEKYTVVEGATSEVPLPVHNLISKVTEQVISREHVNEKDIEVVQTLVRNEGQIEKIQQVLNIIPENTQIIVTAIANK